MKKLRHITRGVEWKSPNIHHVQVIRRTHSETQNVSECHDIQETCTLRIVHSSGSPRGLREGVDTSSNSTTHSPRLQREPRAQPAIRQPNGECDLESDLPSSCPWRFFVDLHDNFGPSGAVQAVKWPLLTAFFSLSLPMLLFSQKGLTLDYDILHGLLSNKHIRIPMEDKISGMPDFGGTKWKKHRS